MPSLRNLKTTQCLFSCLGGSEILKKNSVYPRTSGGQSGLLGLVGPRERSILTLQFPLFLLEMFICFEFFSANAAVPILEFHFFNKNQLAVYKMNNVTGHYQPPPAASGHHHRRTGSKIQGAAPLNIKSDRNFWEFKSDGNNIDILPFWAVSQLSRGIWRALESFTEPQRASGSLRGPQ